MKERRKGSLQFVGAANDRRCRSWTRRGIVIIVRWWAGAIRARPRRWRRRRRRRRCRCRRASPSSPQLLPPRTRRRRTRRPWPWIVPSPLPIWTWWMDRIPGFRPTVSNCSIIPTFSRHTWRIYGLMVRTFPLFFCSFFFHTRAFFLSFFFRVDVYLRLILMYSSTFKLFPAYINTHLANFFYLIFLRFLSIIIVFSIFIIAIYNSLLR